VGSRVCSMFLSVLFAGPFLSIVPHEYAGRMAGLVLVITLLLCFDCYCRQKFGLDDEDDDVPVE
jgi:hypothetical protein